jgi:hypothetical protein
MRTLFLVLYGFILAIAFGFAGACLCFSKQPTYGTYCLFPVNDLGMPTSAVWEEKYVPGIAIRLRWLDVEPTQGVFDWSYIDQAVLLAAQHGKVISVRICPGGSDNSVKDYTPAWVYAAGAKAFTQADASTGKVRTFPTPWDPVFQALWAQFVQAFGARYDSSPYVSYIQIEGPGGPGGEWYLCRSDSDETELNAAGGLNVWITAAQAIIGFYQQAFPTTPLVITNGVVLPKSHDGMSTIVTDYLPAAGQIGDMGCGLYAASAPTDNDLSNESVYKYGPTTFSGFQFDLPQGVGYEADFATVMSAGLGCGMRFIEAYQVDVTDPLNKDTIKSANRAMKRE